jgi:putative cardiolipin synthase
MAASVLAAMLMQGCAGSLQPVESPVETTPPPAQAAQWQTLEALREDDWFKILNIGSEAFDWRLRAIDSATDSIDFQTFIWELDGVGQNVRDHLLAAAGRGVCV